MMKSSFQKQEEDAGSTRQTYQLQHSKDDSLSDMTPEDAGIMGYLHQNPCIRQGWEEQTDHEKENTLWLDNCNS